MRRTVLGIAFLIAAVAPAAAQPPAEPTPVNLTIRPAAAPVPALKYQLLPELKDQTPGNAALIYYRAFSPEWWGNIRRPEVWEKVEKALKTPPEDLPREDLAWVEHDAMLREVDRAARREFVDWELTEPLKKQGIALLLPDVQGFRQVGTLLAVRARLQMTGGHYDQAVATLQTGFALARHVSNCCTLIHSLVALAIADTMMAQLEEMSQRPGAPNLYWALTGLPRPFADLRKGLEGERLSLVATLPMLRDVETRPLTPAEQQTLLKGFGGDVDALLGGGRQHPWTERLVDVGVVLHIYPEARQALIAEGRKPEEVDALPVLQVVVLHSLHAYQRLEDDLFKWYGLPYWEERPHLDEVEKQIRQARARLEGVPFIEFLPAVTKVRFSAARADRHIAALRCVEAIRLYAAGHDGKLPAALGDVTEVPIPLDPVTGQAFDYRATGDGATLSAPPPPGERPNPYNALTYHLTLQR